MRWVWVTLALTGCFRVAETHARELTRLDDHRPGRPPVVVHTLDGDPVEIEGDFRYVRIITGDEWNERSTVVKAPFRAALSEDERLMFQSRGSERESVDLEKVTRLEIVQRDGDRTAVVVLVGVAGVVTGFLLGAYLGKSDETEDVVCSYCAGVAGAVVVGGLSFLIIVPATKYY